MENEVQDKSAPPWNQEGRALERTRVHGHASLRLDNGTELVGRLHDMTHGGISVLLDARLPLRCQHTLQVKLYRNGRLHQLSLPAVCIHETLVGCDGFRHGFQFVALSEANSQALAAVLA